MVKLKSEYYNGYEISFKKGRTQVQTIIKDFPKKGEDIEFLTSTKQSGLGLAKNYIQKNYYSNFKEKVRLALIKSGSSEIDANSKIKSHYDDVMRIYGGQGLTPKETGNIIRSFASANENNDYRL